MPAGERFAFFELPMFVVVEELRELRSRRF